MVHVGRTSPFIQPFSPFNPFGRRAGTNVFHQRLDISPLKRHSSSSPLRAAAREYARKHPGAVERVMIDSSKAGYLMTALEPTFGALPLESLIREADYVAIGSTACFEQGLGADDRFVVWLCLQAPPTVLHLPNLEVTVPFDSGCIVAFAANQPHSLIHPSLSSYNAAFAAKGEVIEALCLVFKSTATVDYALGGTPDLQGYLPRNDFRVAEAA